MSDHSPTPAPQPTAKPHDFIVVRNALNDPTYRPYCMRCPGMVRMQIVSPLYWRCACGAEHDERHMLPAAPQEGTTAMQRELEAWRWLHWGDATASWACACGDVRGSGLSEPCEKCGTPRPAKGVPTDYGFAARASITLSQTDSSLRATEPTSDLGYDVSHLESITQRHWTTLSDVLAKLTPSMLLQARELIDRHLASSPTMTPPEAPTRIIESKAQATVLLYQNTGAEEANRLIERLNDPMTAKIIVTAPNDTFVHQLQLRCAQDPALLDRIDVMYVEKDGTTTRIGLDEEGERCWPPGLFHEDWRISIDLMRTRSPKVAQLMDARAARSTPTEEKANG